MELRIRDVSSNYPGGIPALSRVSLTIPVGVFGLLGPAGAGKSTLLRILATLQAPDDGAITLGDIDLLDHQAELRKTLCYIPQHFRLFPRTCAESLVGYLALMKGIVERRARRQVIDGLLQQASATCSFADAVAMLGDPTLIIVDEPTAGLDPIQRLRFLNLLSELGRERIVIFSTTRIDDLSEVCTRMARIDAGRILLEAEAPSATFVTAPPPGFVTRVVPVPATRPRVIMK